MYRSSFCGVCNNFVVNDFLPRGRAHAARASTTNHARTSTRSAALTPKGRWAASTVSLPRVAVGATVGRGVGETVGLGVVTMTVRTAAAIAA